MTGGCPIRAIAVDSLRLLPPLYVPDNLLAYSVRPSLSNAQSTTYNNFISILLSWYFSY